MNETPCSIVTVGRGSGAARQIPPTPLLCSFLEIGADAEAEFPGLVPIRFQERERIVETQRSHRGSPEKRHTSRRPERIVIELLGTGCRIGGQYRRPAPGIEPPELADIDEEATANAQ